MRCDWGTSCGYGRPAVAYVDVRAKRMRGHVETWELVETRAFCEQHALQASSVYSDDRCRTIIRPFIVEVPTPAVVAERARVAHELELEDRHRARAEHAERIARLEARRAR